MDECVHSGTLCQSLNTVSRELVTDLSVYVTEAGWRRRWACICTGRESGERMDGRWGKNSTQVQSGDWVMGGGKVMGGDQVSGDGQVRSASRTRVHGYWVGVPLHVWVTLAPWETWVFLVIWALDEMRSKS